MTADELEALLPDTEKLPGEISERVVAMGPSAHAAITELLEHEAQSIRAAEDSHLGDRGTHAVTLAGELKVVEAIPALIEIVIASDSMWIIFNEAIHALKKLGPAVVEHVLTRWPTAGDGQRALGEVLGASGVQDERIFTVLVELLAREPELGAMALADYNDPRAIDLIRRELELIEYEPNAGPMGNSEIVELTAAMEELGGELTPSERRKLEAVRADAAAFRASMDLARRRRGEPARATAKPGRNDPCWCGSGKKYKKCHDPELPPDSGFW
ncbi:MAG: SEC-C domain-containing protein [Deltaproteobacteria bacterium]|nr:SEC-C domain-containing protein [Deltaproteobacteria bacterium]